MSCGRKIGPYEVSVTFTDRFWAKVVPNAGGCYRWDGARANTGYGIIMSSLFDKQPEQMELMGEDEFSS